MTLEKYLAAILSGDTTGLPAPTTNVEKYLAKALGVYDGPLPSPVSRIDVYLAAVAERGIGGGGNEGGGGADPVLVALEITKNGIYQPPEGADGFHSVTANVPAGGIEYGVEATGLDASGNWAEVTIYGDVPDSIFKEKSYLTSAKMTDSATKIGGYAFYKTSITDAAIGKNVVEIGTHAYCYCAGLKEAELSDKVVKIGAFAFAECTNLESDIVIPATLTSIGEGAYKLCTKVKKLTWLPRAVQNIYGSYSNQSPFITCSGITEVVLGDGITHIPAFLCSHLSGLTDPITIPESVTFVGEAAYRSCTGIPKVFWEPPSINTVYGSYTNKSPFGGCTNLKEMEFAPQVTKIPQAIALGVSALATVIVRNPDAVVALANTEAFSGALTAQYSYIYVKDEFVEQYKTATNWVSYASKIKPMSEYWPHHKVTSNLLRVTSTNEDTAARKTYTATLASSNGAEIEELVITMGGIDITAEAYADGVINIPEVTGDIVITASAPAVYTETHNWDFTQSLTDSIGGQTVTLAAVDGSDTAPTQDANGLTFDAALQYADLGDIALTGGAIELDIANFEFKGNTGAHIRLMMNAASKGYSPLCWRYNSNPGWAMYNGSWNAPYGEQVTGTSTEVINYFDGKTVRVEYDLEGYPSLYVNGELIGKASLSMQAADGHLYIGGLPASGATQAQGNQAYDMTITGIRVYKEV